MYCIWNQQLFLLFLLNGCYCDYVVNIFLAEFRNPSGALANGSHCDTFYWTGKDDCDMAFKFCVETRGQITEGQSACSSGWYDFGKITTNNNYAEFQTDKMYGNFYNGEGLVVTGDFSLRVPLFQIKMEVNDVDQYDEVLIDEFSTKVSPQNIYEAHGSFVKYDHYRKNIGASATTTVVFYYQVRNISTPSTTSLPETTTAILLSTTTPLVCQNGGTPNSDGIDCSCPVLFSGEYCQIAPRRNCYDLFMYYGKTGKGVFEVELRGQSVQVYCDKGWTLFQRRINDGVSFNRSWAEYADGFGKLDGSFWLGNENIYNLTNGEEMSLRAEFWDCNTPSPNTAYETYHYFKIDSAAKKYALDVSLTGNEGPAKDAINKQTLGESENGQQFSTPDGNDNDGLDGDCARIFQGGWWYSSCGLATPNGVYHPGCNYKLPPDPYGQYFGNGILWQTWYSNIAYSLARTEFKLRPSNVPVTR